MIGYAPGTQGMADRCAPSRLFSEGIEYEGLGIEGLLLRGYAVAMPDYEGLGTAGIHTYMDRVSQGRATLDVVRAAQRLAGTGLSSNSPVGLMGYSQGGGAAASAVELASTYAPDLKVKGAVVGAVPADLAKVATNLDGGLYSAFAFFALRGLSASYDVDLTPYLNATGRATSDRVEQECVFDLLDNAFVKSSTLSANGQPMSALMAAEPFRSIVEAQRIGTIRPTVPVLVTHSALDDVIPYAVGRQMAQVVVRQGRQRPVLQQRRPAPRGRHRAADGRGPAVLRGPLRRAAAAQQLLAGLTDAADDVGRVRRPSPRCRRRGRPSGRRHACPGGARRG